MKKLLLLTILFLSQIFFAQSDCISAIPVCGNSDISYFPTGSGTVDDHVNADGSCLGANEHYSVWYQFTIATSGTLTFTISPQAPFTADYDFAVYGPNVTCGTKGPPIRCNYAAAQPAPNQTGLQLGLTTTTGAWSPAMDVVAGQTYYLIVDNWSGANASMPFSLTWGGTATLTSAFTDPALTPHPFIPPGVPAANPADPNEILKCSLPTMFDFSTLSAGIINGNPNFTVTYHLTSNDAITGSAPITTPIMVDGTTIYYYRLKYTDPANPANPINGCFQLGKFKFRTGNITASDATLFACNNNGAGTGTFDLTAASVYTGTAVITKKYYPTMADLTANTNEITNPSAYVSAPKKVYVKVTTSDGCADDAEITLKFFPVVVVNDATLESCYIETAITTASFDLTLANVTSQAGMTKKYYKTQADAIAGINEITPANAYIAATSVVYVKVTSPDNCYAISKINLKVLPPVKSNVLKDKIICIEDKTTLDAGPGFDGYEWSTGATTQSITNVAAGAYWVKLKTGKCFTLQEVHVYASEQPVITNIDITNDSFTVTVNGGKAPYKYSLDGVNWQDSNVFTGLPRGENVVYVKDAYDCNPITVQVTVPNLLNAITPNGDNKNDYIDYSALAYKKDLVFTVYDRYGNMLYKADKMRNFTWDGTSGGKKIVTGTYWYTISWTESDKNNTQTKYSGWVLVKNIE